MKRLFPKLSVFLRSIPSPIFNVLPASGEFLISRINNYPGNTIFRVNYSNCTFMDITLIERIPRKILTITYTTPVVIQPLRRISVMIIVLEDGMLAGPSKNRYSRFYTMETGLRSKLIRHVFPNEVKAEVVDFILPEECDFRLTLTRTEYSVWVFAPPADFLFLNLRRIEIEHLGRPADKSILKVYNEWKTVGHGGKLLDTIYVRYAMPSIVIFPEIDIHDEYVDYFSNEYRFLIEIFKYLGFPSSSNLYHDLAKDVMYCKPFRRYLKRRYGYHNLPPLYHSPTSGKIYTAYIEPIIDSIDFLTCTVNMTQVGSWRTEILKHIISLGSKQYLYDPQHNSPEDYTLCGISLYNEFIERVNEVPISEKIENGIYRHERLSANNAIDATRNKLIYTSFSMASSTTIKFKTNNYKLIDTKYAIFGYKNIEEAL